jgi:hypothetical protein
MAEFEKQAKQARLAGQQRVPHPKEGQIRRQNAERVAARARAASLYEQIAQTSGQDLDRAGDQRTVGGRFEKLQKVPKRKAVKQSQVSFKAIADMLKSLSFDPREIEYHRQSGITTTSGTFARSARSDAPQWRRQIISRF